MVVLERSGPMVGGVAVVAQDTLGPSVGTLADVPVAGAGAGDPHNVAEAAFLNLVGEHLLGHRRTADVAAADECHVQQSRIRHLAPPAAPRRSRHGSPGWD